MQTDSELEMWRRQWQAGTAVPPDLKQRVEREIRRRRYGVVGAIAVTIAFGLGVPAWAIASRRADVAVLAVAVWVFIAITWTVSWRLSRGLSKPAAATTAAYLDFSILSCQRRRSSIAAASVLYVVMLTFNLVWRYQAQPTPPGVWTFLTSMRIVIAGVITAALAVLAAWSRRRLAREHRNLVSLRRQLEGQVD